MLETNIKELTLSINTLIEELKEMRAAAYPVDQPKTMPKKVKEVKEPEAEIPREDSAGKTTFEEIKKAVLALAKKEKGRDTALKILKGYDAEKVTEVSEENYTELLNKLQEALND